MRKRYKDLIAEHEEAKAEAMRAIHAEYMAGGCTLCEIAEQEGVHISTLLRWFGMFGLPSKNRGRRYGMTSEGFAARNAEIRAAMGTLKEIGTDYGLSGERVRQIKKGEGA